MSSKHNPWLRTLCLAFIVSLSLLFTGSSSRADEDDHSYLPPWMRDEVAAAGNRNEKVNLPNAPRDEAQAPAAEAQLVRIAEPPSSNFGARITHAKAKVVKLVSNLFSKSARFVKGE